MNIRAWSGKSYIVFCYSMRNSNFEGGQPRDVLSVLVNDTCCPFVTYQIS